MPQKHDKYHYIYKTTNKVTGKFYIGLHSTNNLNDGYMGSGKRLKYSLNKYGCENHVVEILEFSDSRDELCEREKEIITEDLLSLSLCMNLALGGGRGFDYINKRSEIQQKAQLASIISQKELRKDPAWVRKKYENTSKGQLKSYENGRKRLQPLDWTGRKHSEEAKLKMSNSRQGTMMGEKNSQFNTMWIYSEELEINKKINKKDKIPTGWKKGNVQNFNKYFDKIEMKKEAVHKRMLEKEKRINLNKKEAKRLISLFDVGVYMSLRSFALSDHYDKSFKSLSVFFRKYLPGYAARFGRPRKLM